MQIKTDKPYRIFAEHVEQSALDQFEVAMSHEAIVRGALMPDAHTGYSLPIGGVVASKDVIFPSFVGYDQGCGVAGIRIQCSVDAIKRHATEIFHEIYRTVPVGFNGNQVETPHETLSQLPVSDTLQTVLSDGYKQLGSLGSGNHFIEIGSSTSLTEAWVIVHSGSRGVGHKIASHYMRIASGDGKAREGNFGLEVNSANGKTYIQDLAFCLEFALANRREIIRRACDAIETFTRVDGMNMFINRNHNHAELKDGLWIHRKGATHAESGMLGIIPGNMRDGSFVVRGKGNPEALFSSSHGAGRVMGRKEAQKKLDIDRFRDTMNGVTAKVDADTLDESPEAYKDIFEVMRMQDELVDVIEHVKPIINVKG
jgi:tRNA-splicing ligase RtcB (3'-phosphate/5'-hydroxy nucleic acid ligase)